MNKSVKEIIDHNRILIERIKEKNEVIFRYREALEDIKNNKTYLEGTNELIIAINTDDYDWLTEQAERVQELESENNALKTVARSNKFIGEHYRQQNKRYREAIEFYANENNYEIWNSMAVRSPEINRDKGYKARKALEGSE